MLATGYSEAGREGFSVLRKPYAPDAVEAAIQQAATGAAAMAYIMPFRTPI